MLSPNLEFSASKMNVMRQQLKTQIQPNSSCFRVSTSGHLVSSDIEEVDETGIENMSVCLTEKK